MKLKCIISIIHGLIVPFCLGDIQEDGILFASGGKKTWNSSGIPEANGMKMTISYPKNWREEPGDRVGVAKKFVSSEAGESMIVLITKIADTSITEEEKKQVLSKDLAGKVIPSGATLISHALTKIDGEDCAMIECDLVTEHAGIQIGQRILMFMLIWKDYAIIIQTSAGGPLSKFDETKIRFKKAKPVFMALAASCIITDKWETK